MFLDVGYKYDNIVIIHNHIILCFYKHCVIRRLREDHRLHGLQPPLRETLSLSDSGLSDGASLVLESGRPPGDGEMTVAVNFVVGGKLVARQELLVDRQLSVASLLKVHFDYYNL